MDEKVLGREVSRRRKQLNLTQEMLADRAGISRNYVSLIERGEVGNISIKVLNELANALDTTPAELGGPKGWGETLVPPSLREFALQQDLSFDIVERLVRLPRRGREPQNVDEWQRLYDLVRSYLTNPE